jgi:hypothetical protein
MIIVIAPSASSCSHCMQTHNNQLASVHTCMLSFTLWSAVKELNDTLHGGEFLALLSFLPLNVFFSETITPSR